MDLSVGMILLILVVNHPQHIWPLGSLRIWWLLTRMAWLGYIQTGRQSVNGNILVLMQSELCERDWEIAEVHSQVTR